MPLVDESDINVIVSTKGHCDGRINIVSYDLVSKLQKRIEGTRSECFTFFVLFFQSSKSESSELTFSHASAKLCEPKYHLSETATMSASVTVWPEVNRWKHAWNERTQKDARAYISIPRTNHHGRHDQRRHCPRLLEPHVDTALVEALGRDQLPHVGVRRPETGREKWVEPASRGDALDVNGQ
jgi:hypothetical protein